MPALVEPGTSLDAPPNAGVSSLGDEGVPTGTGGGLEGDEQTPCEESVPAGVGFDEDEAVPVPAFGGGC